MLSGRAGNPSLESAALHVGGAVTNLVSERRLTATPSSSQSRSLLASQLPGKPIVVWCLRVVKREWLHTAEPVRLARTPRFIACPGNL